VSAITFCTIAARNYLARARVLAASLQRFYPDARLVLVIVDDAGEERANPANAAFEILPLEEIGLDVRELHLRAAIYDVTEFSTSIKPWLMTRLLDDGAELLVYVDPDIELYAPIDDLILTAAEHDLVITPSTTAPVPYDSLSPHESDFLRTGLFNLGYVAVAQRGRGFLEWWMPRLRRDCVRAEAAGYFVDQRWVDLAPFYFDAQIVADPGCNVAWWNLAQHEVGRAHGTISIDDWPLRFFHFSSFDPLRPDQICTLPLVRPLRYELADFPPIVELCQAYAERLLAAGHNQAASQPYGLAASASGLPLDRRMRRIFREALLAAENEGTADDLPDPFGDADGFDAWLREPAPRGVPVPRYLQALWSERSDLQGAFPGLVGDAGRGFLDWVADGGLADPPVPIELIPGSLERL
jgi:hypothetical protein